VRSILVVDDEPAVRDALERALKAQHYAVTTAVDGRQALDVIANERPELVLLDVLMPVMDGFEACRRLSGSGTARRCSCSPRATRWATGSRALDAGADDYVVKPFALEELLARCRALLRRSGVPGDDPLRFSDLVLDPVTREVHRAERAIELSRTEYNLLELFLLNPRRVLTREVMFDRVWGYDFGPTSNTLEVYVGYLRRKTEAEGEPRLIHTVRGVGYVLKEPA
jgi:two-component system response regulator MprA